MHNDPTPADNEDELNPLYNPATQDYKNSPVDEFDIDIPEDDIEAIYNPETMQYIEDLLTEEENEDTP